MEAEERGQLDPSAMGRALEGPWSERSEPIATAGVALSTKDKAKAKLASARERGAAAEVRVRVHIIGNAHIENVGKYQSCMVSKVRIIWKQTVDESGELVGGGGEAVALEGEAFAAAVASITTNDDERPDSALEEQVRTM